MYLDYVGSMIVTVLTKNHTTMKIYVNKEEAVTDIRVVFTVKELIVLAELKGELDECLGEDGDLIRNPVELPECTVRKMRTLLGKIVQETKSLRQVEYELLLNDKVDIEDNDF